MDHSGRHRVLIAGGGVAALEATLALRALAEERVSVELLAPEPHFWYRPLSVATPFQLGEVKHFELDGLTRALGAGFTPAALASVDDWRHVAHTSLETEIPYDTLLVACGAVPSVAIPGAVTFRGPADRERIEHLLDELTDGEVRSLAFALPWGAAWPLPIYELALLTASYLETRGIQGVELTVVTPEQEPLEVFGPSAAEALRKLLAERHVHLLTDAYPSEVVDDELRLVPEGSIHADRVVALPRLRGAPIEGLPQTVYGFVPVDEYCRVRGVADVFAAGDITSFSVKQGGIATQQADVAAEAIAKSAGVEVTPAPFRPVLRGLLLTGNEPRYLRHEMTEHPEREPSTSVEPLWWPPAKIVGRYLAPYLASLESGDSTSEPTERPSGAVAVDVELDPEIVGSLRSSMLRLDRGERVTEDESVTAAASRAPLQVAPEDTLGEVAEAMLRADERCAVVCEYGRLIGILTIADLLRACGAGVHSSTSRARQWMTAEPITISVDRALSDAALLMAEYGVHHLPIVDDGRPVAMLHVDDVPTRQRAGRLV